MTCFINDFKFHATINGELHGETEARVIDYVNGTWSLQFGDYAGRYEVRATTEDIERLINLLAEMLCNNDMEMAALSGDFENYGETEPKWDEKQTEAWLDTEG